MDLLKHNGTLPEDYVTPHPVPLTQKEAKQVEEGKSMGTLFQYYLSSL